MPLLVLIILISLLLKLRNNNDILVFLLAEQARRSLFVHRRRRWWVIPRQDALWEELFLTRMHDDVTARRYRTSLRMHRDTFRRLVARLTDVLQMQHTNMRQPIPVEKVVAVSLYRLATGCRVWDAAEAFGLGASSASYCLKRFCIALIAVLGRELVCLPAGRELHNVIEGFFELSRIQGIAGALVFFVVVHGHWIMKNN